MSGGDKNKDFFNRPYKFSLRLAAIITVVNFSVIYGLRSFVGMKFTGSFILFIAFLLFVSSFFIIRFFVEKYIYNKINMIYDSVSILDIKDVDEKRMTTDIDVLKREVIKFAETKRLEIETLKAQEIFRREFIGNLSHELKTPLFTVQGYIETLQDGASENKDLLVKYLDRADNGVQRLISITTDLDLITKLETGDQSLDIKEFAIDELAINITNLLELKSKIKNINLVVETDPENPILVCADKDKINQVLVNLISNSLKYGKIDGQTIISFIKRNNKVIVVVKDNGEGIKNIHMNRIFERFYRIDRHRSREEGGSGLGLSIVKHIIEAHNEKLFVESEFTLGSTFTFSLPAC